MVPNEKHTSGSDPAVERNRRAGVLVHRGPHGVLDLPAYRTGRRLEELDLDQAMCGATIDVPLITLIVTLSNSCSVLAASAHPYR
jgi:hypothetical protein